MSSPTQETPLTEREPITDFFESEQGYLLRSELPGVEAQALEVSVLGDSLHIEGRSTRHHFARDYRFGKAADLEQVEAKLEHGLLEIHVPKRAAARPRRIAVNAG